jgi:hypothetical protein
MAGNCQVTRKTISAHLAIASLLMLALLAVTAIPAAAGTPWRAKGAEDLAFKLTNCMRTGGHVTKAGTCRGWGSGRYSAVRPKFKRSDKISNKVSWPWAKKSVQFYGAGSCWIGHSKNGSTVDKRFAAVGLKLSINGENMGCGLYGTARQTVITVIRMWQSEKSYGGSHWRQIKDKDFKSVGIGIARYGSRKTQLVMNYYGNVVD